MFCIDPGPLPRDTSLMARIAIVGPGAIGSVIAAWLTRTGRHTLVLCGRRPIENLVVESDTPARVVIDERTGTIVIGNDVKISRVAISHGTLTVRITEAPRVVQPEPFSKGETAVEPFTAIDASRPDARVAVLDGPDLETLVSGLNRLGVKPDGIIAILQGIKSAGALQAELVLQ